MNRKIILNIAISLDGFIADENGGFEWIVGDGDKRHNTKNLFDFDEFINGVDTIIIGRNSYEDCGIDNFKDKQVLVVTSKQVEDYENVKFINDNITAYVEKLKRNSGKNIWIFGGGVTADQFIKTNTIDEYIIGIIPIILGKGKPLFFEDNPNIKLHLNECTVQEGITILRYSKRI